MGRESTHLRAVPDGEAPVPPRAEPETLVEATGLDRRTFLAAARKRIAAEIDGGVPAHALGRLIAEMERLDSEVRRIDAADEQEARRRGDSARERRSFDASAI